ncbi:MAG: sporulation integral membrane protein YtvI [Clostridia bacterium]
MKRWESTVAYAAERLVLRCLLVAAVAWLVLSVVPQVWSILSPFIIGLVAAAMLQPLIHFVNQKLHIKRGIAVGLCVMLMLVAALLLLYWFASFAVVQLISAAENAPSIIANVVGILQTATNKLLGMAQTLPEDIGRTIHTSLDSAFKSLSDAGMSLAGGLVNALLSFATSLPYAFIYANFLVIGTIFITNRYESLQGYLQRHRLSDANGRIRLLRQSAGKGMVGYLRVQLLFSVLTLLVGWVFFQAVGFHYAFLIGFVAALMEMIPQFGCGMLYIPWSAVCFIVGASHSGWLVLGLYLVYSLIRRVTEPALLGSNLGVSPLLSLIGMFVGMRLGGVIGIILGPIVMVVLVSAVRAHLFDGVLRDLQTLLVYMSARWKRGQGDAADANQ